MAVLLLPSETELKGFSWSSPSEGQFPIMGFMLHCIQAGRYEQKKSYKLLDGNTLNSVFFSNPPGTLYFLESSNGFFV